MQAELEYVPRGRHRLKLFQPAQMRANGEVVRVHVLNISRTGALVHWQGPLEPGTVVDLMLVGAERQAAVVWQTGARIGVQFAAPLTPEELDAVIACEAADVAERRRNHIL